MYIANFQKSTVATNYLLALKYCYFQYIYLIFRYFLTINQIHYCDDAYLLKVVYLRNSIDDFTFTL